MINLSSLRREYSQSKLLKSELNLNPFIEFEHWLNTAKEANITLANAMVLASATRSGSVSARTVLLQYASEKEGFVFFTNYNSQKAQQIRENNQVALTFNWLSLERQIHITGYAKKISERKSASYFATRPRESQISAWASHQSAVVDSREALEYSYQKLAKSFAKNTIPKPEFWGGYCVIAHHIEFWQGRNNRLHDRFLYRKDKKNNWFIMRLAP